MIITWEATDQPSVQPPTCRAMADLIFWHLTFDLSGMGGPASTYATASIALRISDTYKPPNRDMVDHQRLPNFIFHHHEGVCLLN